MLTPIAKRPCSWIAAAVALAVIPLGIALPTVARAQLVDRATRHADSLPTWRLSIRTGPYRPLVTSNSAGRHYFNLVYRRGKGKSDSLFAYEPLMTSVEVDWYLLRGIGEAGLTFGVGYWGISGKARLCTDASGKSTDCPLGAAGSKPGNTQTSFLVLPLSIGLVYNFDLLQRAWGVPLVPYAKAGVDYQLWWDHANGKISQITRNKVTYKGSGATIGLHVAAGLAVNLNWIEPDTARDARASNGLDGSYLFGEIEQIMGNPFRGSGHFDGSATLISVGLALEFL